MRPIRRWAIAALVLAGLGVTGCGATTTPAIPRSSRLVPVPGSKVGKIILSAVGAQRIGIQTSPAQTSQAGGTSVTVPYSAVVYDPSGKTYAFSKEGPLTYTEVPITINHISGNVVYLTRGPSPGTAVVTVGAEELYGVQTGVLSQT